MDNMEIVLLDSFYSSSDDDDAVFDLHLSLLTRKKYNKRRFWISNHIRLREDYGEFRLFNELDEEKFFNYYRMNKTKLFELHAMIEDDIMKQETHLRKSISSLERLAITLRYLATGDSFTSMAYSYRMGLCTVSGIVESVCDAIWNHLQPLVLKEPTENEWKEIAEDFKNIWHFDHCVGAIDGKHVVIKAPPHSGSNFFNYKKTFSIVLLAVVDAKKRFIYIDVGSMGRYSDGGILNDSVFGHKLKTNNLNLPPDEPLCPGGPELPYVFIGDEAFPLLINLMRAYQKSKLTDSRRIFNYRLSRARQVVENAFGILTVRWRVYRKPFECRVELVDKIVNATCVLHNYLINDNSNIFNESEILSTENQLTPLSHSGFRYSNESFFIREEFCRFFNTSGTVPWQITRIQKRLLRM